MTRTLAAVCLVCLVLVPANLRAEQNNNGSSFTFALKVQGVGGSTGSAIFKSVSGLKSETDVVEVREGGVNNSPKKLAGVTKYANIVLKRGLTADISVASWRRVVEDGHFEQARRDGVIVLYDRSNREVARWTIVNAWPSAIAIETDNDTGDPMEVITLAVEGSHRQ